jgi:hypothetical protein
MGARESSWSLSYKAEKPIWFTWKRSANPAECAIILFKCRSQDIKSNIRQDLTNTIRGEIQNEKKQQFWIMRKNKRKFIRKSTMIHLVGCCRTITSTSSVRATQSSTCSFGTYRKHQLQQVTSTTHYNMAYLERRDSNVKTNVQSWGFLFF